MCSGEIHRFVRSDCLYGHQAGLAKWHNVGPDNPEAMCGERGIMKGPKTYDEYVDLVHNAVYEIDEMRAGIEYDPENAERWSAMLDHLDGVLRKMYDEMVADTYQFPTGRDLPYMQFVNRWGREIPFKQLLAVINETHKNGLSRG